MKARLSYPPFVLPTRKFVLITVVQVIVWTTSLTKAKICFERTSDRAASSADLSYFPVHLFIWALQCTSAEDKTYFFSMFPTCSRSHPLSYSPSLPSTPPLSLLDDPHFLPPIPQPYSSQTLLLTTSRYLERQQKDFVKITWSNFVEKNGMRFYGALERQVRDQIKRTSDTTRRDTLEWMTKSTS